MNKAGIIINLLMSLILIVLIVLGIVFSNNLHNCENNPSPFCYDIQCPCDDFSQGPCFGYALRLASDGVNFNCSNSVLSTVNSSGSLV